MYGRPTEHVETTVPVPTAFDELEQMTPEQRVALLAQPGRGKRLRLVDDDGEEHGLTD